MHLLTYATPLKRRSQNNMLLTSMYRTENYDCVVSLSHAHSKPTQFAGTDILPRIDYYKPFMLTCAANPMQTSFIGGGAKLIKMWMWLAVLVYMVST